MLIEVFWGLIRGPKTKSSKQNFNETVNQRCKLFEEGNWKQLWSHLVYKKGKQKEGARVSESEEEALGRKAKQAQAHVTKSKSVSAAMKVIRSPLSRVSENGMLEAFSKLHPQTGDCMKPPPPQNFVNKYPLTPLSDFEKTYMEVRRPIATQEAQNFEPTVAQVSFKVHEYKIRRGNNGTAGGLNGVGYLILKSIFKQNDKLANQKVKKGMSDQ
mmetsp:Transcript_24370/g.28683  ORF Transcript_24370/g.28683 Transcript_24370/m.28683 type:complete len:214 (+) Transcript_24370:4081-4722(+)